MMDFDDDYEPDDDRPRPDEEAEWQRHVGWDAEPGDPYFDWSSLSLEDLEYMTYGEAGRAASEPKEGE